MQIQCFSGSLIISKTIMSTLSSTYIIISRTFHQHGNQMSTLAPPTLSKRYALCYSSASLLYSRMYATWHPNQPCDNIVLLICNEHSRSTCNIHWTHPLARSTNLIITMYFILQTICAIVICKSIVLIQYTALDYLLNHVHSWCVGMLFHVYGMLIISKAIKWALSHHLHLNVLTL